ncbi:MAG: thymidine kinase [Sediminibacterium sp.]
MKELKNKDLFKNEKEIALLSMFIEQNFSKEKRGWLEVVCGSMFSGKTEELIRRLKRARIANLKVEIYKPATDTRYDTEKVVSHDANSIPSVPIDHAKNILLLAEHADVVGIDEAQFFDEEIVRVCETLIMQGKRVIVAGLDMDYLGKPFGSMPQLLAIADFITKLHAICVQCGHLANISHRTSDEKGTVVLGEKNNYEPRCRICAAK